MIAPLSRLLLCLLLTSGCLAVPVKRLVVLHTNDTHGQLFPFDEEDLGGLARRATLVARERAEAASRDAATLVVDAGDVNTGTYESDSSGGLLDLAAMHAIGYDAMAVGNHEFDLREPARRAFTDAIRFPLLSANIRAPDGSREYQPWTLITRGERRIALVGLVTPATPDVSTFGRSAPVRFTDPAVELEECLQEIEALEPPADAVLVLSHLGDHQDRRLIPGFNGRVTAWIGGHSHGPALARFPGRTLYVRAGAKGRYLGRFEILFQGGEAFPFGFSRLPVDSRIPEDPEVAALLPDPARGASVARASGPIPKLHPQGRHRSGPLGNLMADAQRVMGGCDMALVNRGSLRVRSLPAGPLQARQLYAVCPFKNSLTRFTLDADQVQAVFEEAAALGSHSNAFPDISGAEVRVTSGEVRVRVGGEPLRPGRSYTLGVTDFLAKGGDGYRVFLGLPTPEVVEATPAEMLIEYARRERLLVPDDTARVLVGGSPP